MKLRSYLRGIGIGILLAAGICICASLRSGSGKTMTDEEIKARAKELGMTEETVLADLTVEPTTSVVEVINEPESSEEVATELVDEGMSAYDPAADEEASSEEEPTPEPTPETTPEPTPEVTPEPTPETTPEPTKAASESTGDTVTITVEKGNGSDTVAKKLEAAGLVSNAHDYDVWLMQNGYDRIIAAGEHKIPKGASNEEIAKILCNR